jgi:hypothetical protein
MKKIFSLALVLCLMVSVLCIMTFTASAEEPGATQEPAPGTVLRLSALKTNGDLEFIKDYTSFEEGWNAAMDLADNTKKMRDNNYDRVVVDLYADWTANEKGVFGDDDGTGFEEDTIYIPDDCRVTINMNGHTINRGLSDWEYDGEVIYIYEDSDVIINGGKSGDPIIAPGQDPGDVKMGTITGGFSCNGAGGIHINEANVTLNNVNLTNNKVEDDDGAAIAIHYGGHLTMNGGSMSNNHLTSWYKGSMAKSNGTLYANDSSAVLNEVIISGNTSSVAYQHGLAVSLLGDSNVTLNNCIVENNGESTGTKYSATLFYSDISDCVLIINGGRVTNNYTKSGLFYFDGNLEINGGIISDNHADTAIFHINQNTKTHANINNVTIIDNACPVNICADEHPTNSDYELNFNNCTVNNNGIDAGYAFCGPRYGTVTLTDCSLGNSEYTEKDSITFVDTNAPDGVPTASIFGEGSLAVILSLLAIISSAVSICLTVVYNKKKTVPVAASVTEDESENESEE